MVKQIQRRMKKKAGYVQHARKFIEWYVQVRRFQDLVHGT